MHACTCMHVCVFDAFVNVVVCNVCEYVLVCIFVCEYMCMCVHMHKHTMYTHVCTRTCTNTLNSTRPNPYYLKIQYQVSALDQVDDSTVQ